MEDNVASCRWGNEAYRAKNTDGEIIKNIINLVEKVVSFTGWRIEALVTFYKPENLAAI